VGFSAVNAAPTLRCTQAALAGGTEDTAYTVSATDLLAGFSDADGDALSITGLTASNGTVLDNNNGSYTITPQRRALLNTIRYAEGTWKQGQEGYRTLYGGGRFSSLERHPEIVVVKRYTSAAAGAYQFLPGTWSEAARKLQLESFEPSSQDQAALYLVDRRGMLDHIDQQGLTREAMAVLAREWASFPTLAGRSAYGQPVKRADELQRFYSSNLKALAAQA